MAARPAGVCSACLECLRPDPPHGWIDGHAAVNRGNYDGWVPNKGITTMTYHTRGYPAAMRDGHGLGIGQVRRFMYGMAP